MKDIIYQVYRVADVDGIVAVGVSGFNRIGRRAILEDMAGEEDYVTDICQLVVIGIAADVSAGIADTIMIRIQLIRV